MKTTFKLGLILLAVILTACTKVAPGTVGVMVDLYGSSKGVQNQVVGPGRYWVGPNQELHTFPTYQQNYVWTRSAHEGSPNDESITFQSIEGMEINGDFGVTYEVDPNKVSELFQKYRKDLTDITDGPVRNLVRDALTTSASTMEIQHIYGDGKAELMLKVQGEVREAMKPNGIIIDRIYQIGSFRLPNQIIEAVNNKIAATQKAQQRENELREAEAEAKKTVAKAEGEAKSKLAIAEADAKANELKRQTLTAELIQYEAIQKWDGRLPTVTGSGPLPFIQVTPPTK